MKYPDALRCLHTLKERDLAIGIVGNQPGRTEEMLADCGVEVDFVGSSETWGVAKPAPEAIRVASLAELPEALDV